MNCIKEVVNMNLKIALCQMNVIDNKKKNIEKAIAMIKESKDKNADIAILPEMFNCPYENEKFLEYSEKEDDSYSLNSISTIANDLNIYVLAGSIPEKVIRENNSFNDKFRKSNKNISDKNQNKEFIYNTSFLFDENGEIIAKHRKMHLFDIDIKDRIYFKESDTLSSGNDITVVDTKFGKIGIGICYDIRFPELSRLMALEGAEILIFPGAFNLTTGPAHWEMLFRTRALDNQVFTIGVSPALDEFSAYNSYGHSILCNPWGEVVKELSYEEELTIVDINLDEMDIVREELPLLKNRRTDLYNLKKL